MFPLLSFNIIVHYLFSNSFIISVARLLRAIEIGVKPSVSFTFRFAPYFKSNRTILTLLFSTAEIKGYHTYSPPRLPRPSFFEEKRSHLNVV